MDQLVDFVSQKTGLSQEHSRTAAEAVLTFLKKKLPPPIAGQIDSVLGESGSEGSGAGHMSDVAKGIGSVFGKK